MNIKNSYLKTSMQKELEKILLKNPGIKAKEIAKKLQLDKTAVNSVLYANPNQFQIDKDYGWSVNSSELRVEFPENCWLDCIGFEAALASSGSPLKSDAKSIVFVIPENCSLLLEAIARLMALANQLVYLNKQVTIAFENKTATSYLNRMGFFEHLNEKIGILPSRPKVSTASKYKGSNDKLVEFGAIDPINPDESIPKELKASFVSQAGTQYSQAAFTVLTELFGNVRDHSKSPIPGFVALQCYKKGRIPHIQTVISDSGKGILGTLKPILSERYPEIAQEIKNSEINADILLLEKVFTKGQISQSEEDGRGLGLKSSSDAAAKFNATVLVRQENCEVRFHFRVGKKPTLKYDINMPNILGTHICFDFLLDRNE